MVCRTIYYEHNNQLNAKINDLTECRTVLDSGLERGNIIPKKIIEKHNLEHPNDAIILQQCKRRVPLAFADLEEIENCDEYVQISISIETGEGTCTLHNVTFVVSKTVKEILIGDDTLTIMGISPTQNLKKKLRGQNTQGILKYDMSDEAQLTKIVARLVNTDASTFCMREKDDREVAPELGHIDHGEVQDFIERSIILAKKAGMTNKNAKKLRKLLLIEYRDIFRTKLGTDPPMKVEPASYKLKPGATPVRCRPRFYRTEEKKYMQDMIKMLEKHGLIYMNMNSTWASPVLIVKRPEGGFRLVCDLREVNKQCEATVWPMPKLEQNSPRLSNAKIFFTLDFFKGFWMMPLSRESQELFSMMTDDAVYTPTRTLQGALNSTAQFQARMTKIFQDLKEKYIDIWIDDLLGFASDEEQLLERLTEIFQRAKEFNLKINPKKCQWYARSVKWCGRIYSHEGVTHDPQRIEALSTMPAPQNMYGLTQFLHAVNWMRSNIVDYARLVLPLTKLVDKLRKIQQKHGLMKETSVRICEEDWTPEVANAYENTKKSLMGMVKLAYPKEKHKRCVFPDASGEAWSCVITQIPAEDVGKPVRQQRHEPLAFYGKRWTNSEKNWTIAEQEAAAIVRGLDRGAYLVQGGSEFLLYTDHRNLTYIFNTKDLQKHKRTKLERWALLLQSFNYHIQHIDGEQNVWADLLSRWGAAGEEALKARRTRLLVRAMTMDDARVTPRRHAEFEWPSEESLKNSQQQLSAQEMTEAECSKEDYLWRNQGGKIIIPQQDEDMRVRLWVMAHAGAAGHFSEYATRASLEEKFHWAQLKDDVAQMCQQCIHCVAVKGGKREPRPWGYTLQGRKQFEVLQVDYFYVSPLAKGTQHNFKYILVMKDEFSGFVWFVPTEAPNTRAAAEAIVKWMADYCCCPQYLVSDQGSHFTSELMGELTRLMGIEHHMVVAYSPWANSVERANRTLKRTLTAMINEAGADPQDWPWFCPALQQAVNSAPRKRNQGLSPAKILLGRQHAKPLDLVFLPPAQRDKMKRIAPIERLEEYEKLVQHLEDIQEVHDKHKAKSRDEIQRASKGKMERFIEGDFVLLAKVKQRPGDKILLRWRGPYRVVKATGTHTYRVQHLVTKETKEAHIQRLRKYADRDLAVTEEMRAFAVTQGQQVEVEKLVDIRQDPNTQCTEICVQWRGFGADECTWEPAAHIAADVPGLLKRLKRNLSKKETEKCELLRTVLETAGR